MRGVASDNIIKLNAADDALGETRKVHGNLDYPPAGPGDSNFDRQKAVARGR